MGKNQKPRAATRYLAPTESPPLELSIDRSSTDCEVLNISSYGVAVRPKAKLILTADSSVKLSWENSSGESETVDAQVCWVSVQPDWCEVGLRFVGISRIQLIRLGSVYGVESDERDPVTGVAWFI